MAWKRFGKSIGQALGVGILLVVPLYLAVLLLLKAMKSLSGLVRPVARLMPGSFPGATVVPFCAIVLLCLLVGLALRTSLGYATLRRIENSILYKIPGYEVLRSMTRQVAGQSQGTAWQPALAEIEDAFVPAFIVEELEDHLFTVFVPSVPTPFAGAIYILSAERVHPLDVPFTHALRVVTRWGSGSRELVNAMHSASTTVTRTGRF